MMTLTKESRRLFKELAFDAENWSGVPLLPELTQQQKGNLTDLKKKALLAVDIDEGVEWVIFTDAGKNLAKSFGANIDSM